MAKVNATSTTETYMKVALKRTSTMVMANLPGKLVAPTLETGQMALLQDRVKKSTRVVTFTKVHSSKANLMATVNVTTKTATSTMEIGKPTHSMDKALSTMPMETFTLEPGAIIRELKVT